jgi:hypothetical protein
MLALTATAAHPAEQDVSANAILPGCKAMLREKNISDPDHHFRMGHCAGILTALTHFTRLFGACRPDNVTAGQVIRVVVTYIERQPERWHEDFRDLALAAMRSAWPCKQQ